MKDPLFIQRSWFTLWRELPKCVGLVISNDSRWILAHLQNYLSFSNNEPSTPKQGSVSKVPILYLGSLYVM